MTPQAAQGILFPRGRVVVGREGGGWGGRPVSGTQRVCGAVRSTSTPTENHSNQRHGGPLRTRTLWSKGSSQCIRPRTSATEAQAEHQGGAEGAARKEVTRCPPAGEKGAVSSSHALCVHVCAHSYLPVSSLPPSLYDFEQESLEINSQFGL